MSSISKKIKEYKNEYIDNNEPLNEIKDKTKTAREVYSSLRNPARFASNVAKAGSKAFENITGGGNDLWDQYWEDSQNANPITRNIKKIPVIGSIMDNFFDAGGAAMQGLSNVFGFDLPEAPHYTTHDGKKIPAEVVEETRDKIKEEYNEKGGGINGAGVYDTGELGRVIVDPQGGLHWEIFTSKKNFKRLQKKFGDMIALRKQQRAQVRAKKRFTLSAKKYDTQTVDGTKIFLWKENGKSHMYVNDDNRKFDDVVKRIKKRVDDRARNAHDPELLSKAEKNWNARQKRLYGKITESYGDMVTRLRNR